MYESSAPTGKEKNLPATICRWRFITTPATTASPPPNCEKESGRLTRNDNYSFAGSALRASGMFCWGFRPPYFARPRKIGVLFLSNVLQVLQQKQYSIFSRQRKIWNIEKHISRRCSITSSSEESAAHRPRCSRRAACRKS